MLTRLGEDGADALAIMRIAGHSSVTVAQRYVRPLPETLEKAFDGLELCNGQRVARQLPEVQQKRLLPTVSTIHSGGVAVTP